MRCRKLWRRSGRAEISNCGRRAVNAGGMFRDITLVPSAEIEPEQRFRKAPCTPPSQDRSATERSLAQLDGDAVRSGSLEHPAELRATPSDQPTGTGRRDRLDCPAVNRLEPNEVPPTVTDAPDLRPTEGDVAEGVMDLDFLTAAVLGLLLPLRFVKDRHYSSHVPRPSSSISGP